MHCLLVDSHPVTLLGLQLLIQGNYPGWKVSTTTSVCDVKTLIDVSNDEPIDLIVLDLVFHLESGISFLSYLQRHPPMRPISIIVISTLTDEETIGLCKKLGAKSWVSKNSGTNEIIRAVQLVSSGKEYFCAGNASQSAALTNQLPKLTSRQRDLIDLLLEGHSNKMIASILNLCYGTVKNYMFDLMRLMSVESRLKLVTKIRESGYNPHHTINPEPMNSVQSVDELVDDPLDASA